MILDIKTISFSSAQAEFQEIVFRERWLPERVLKDDFTVATFFETGILFLAAEFATNFCQMMSVVNPADRYMIVPLPSDNSNSLDMPDIASFPPSLLPTEIPKALKTCHSVIDTPWSIFARYVISSSSKDWIIWGDNSIGIAFLAFRNSVSEFLVRRATIEFEASGDCIGNIDQLLRNRGVREIVGASRWPTWSKLMRDSYSRKN